MSVQAQATQLVPADGAKDGRFRIEGAIGFGNAADLLESAVAAFAGQPAIDVDLAGVTHADSAALALLLVWMERARRNGQRMLYRNIPAQLTGIARISEVDGFLAEASASD